MKKELKKAGVNTAAARLGITADKALRYGKNQATAMRVFRTAILTDAELLVELIGVTVISERCNQYLLARKKSTESGVSQPYPESHVASDRSALDPSSSRSSHESRDSLKSSDRPTAPSTKISRKAAVMATQTGLWNERVAASFEMRIGDITQYDFLNLTIQNEVSTVWKKGLSKVIWPDMHTPLKEFANKKEIRKIRDDAIAALEAALKAVKGITHEK